jgi:WD40 repeat protein
MWGHSSDVWAINFSPDSKYLASGSRDKTIKLWSVAEQKEIKKLQGHTASVLSVCFSPDGNFLASGSVDNMVKVWSIQLCKEVKTF